MAKQLTREQLELFQDYHPIENIQTVLDKRDKDELLVTDDFLKGKQNDAAAAKRLIDMLCSKDFFERALARFDTSKPLIFLTIPSTSHQNQVPIALAQSFVKYAAEKGLRAHYVVADEYINTLHAMMMKSIKSHLHRAFAVRVFEESQPGFLTAFQKLSQNAQVILTDDVLTTGASLNTFKRFLDKNDIQSVGVVGLKGTQSISPRPVDILKLANQIKTFAPSVDGIALGKELSMSELGAVRAYLSNVSHTYQNAFAASKMGTGKLKVFKMRRAWQEYRACSEKITLMYRSRVQNDLDAVYELQKIVEREVSSNGKKEFKGLKGILSKYLQGNSAEKNQHAARDVFEKGAQRYSKSR